MFRKQNLEFFENSVNYMKHIFVFTHSGTFHADEVFAVALLKLYAEINARYFDWDRVKELPKNLNFHNRTTYVVDIGGRYLDSQDPDIIFLDHHQDKNLLASNMLLYYYLRSSNNFKCFEALFSEISEIDLGKKDSANSISSLIRSMNGEENGFREALDIAYKHLKRLYNNYLQEKEDKVLFNSLPKITVGGVTLIDNTNSTKQFLNWKSYFEETDHVFLVVKNERNNHFQLISNNSEKNPCPEHESCSFMHNSKFTATYNVADINQLLKMFEEAD